MGIHVAAEDYRFEDIDDANNKDLHIDIDGNENDNSNDNTHVKWR